MPAPSPERAQAVADGRQTYFTGKPCKRGHVAERYTTTKTCILCYSEWRRENLERERKRMRDWSSAHREVTNARTAAWRAANPDRQRAAEINYRKSNPEKRKGSCARYREQNPEAERERGKRWRAENKPRLAAKSAARRAVRAQATPPWADLAEIAALYEEASRLTELTGKQWEVDHIIPLVHDLVCGLHCEGNLQVITATENRKKCNRLPAHVFDPVSLT